MPGALTVRPFRETEYPRLVDVMVRVDPSRSVGADELRHRDETLEPRVRLLRLAVDAADGPGDAVGFGRLMHMWWNFHPRRFNMRIDVDPDWQGQGVGSALFERLMSELITWDPELVRGEVRGDAPAAQRFVEKRGFRELRRRWESVLEVAEAREDAVAASVARAQSSGIEVVRYADEIARRPREDVLQELYAVEARLSMDEPGMDRSGEVMSFQAFYNHEIGTPKALPDGHFLAKDGDRIVGLSRVLRDPVDQSMLQQGLTGVDPDYRGRGIAQALKVRTIEYARAHGYARIRTSNDSSNEPMLHINMALGFKRETPVIVYERRFD